MQEPDAGRMPQPEEVSEVLREIVAGPDFATFGEGVRWELMRRLGELLEDLWLWMRQLLGEQTGAAEFLTILIVLAAAAVLALVTARHAAAWFRRSGREPPDAPPEEPASAGAWLRLATERAERGELRPAATALYQGFLLTLAQRGALSFHSSKTPGDYALELGRAEHGAAAAGGRFLDSFQDFSFGRRMPAAERYAGLARMARDAGCRAAEPGRNATPEAAGAGDDTAAGRADAKEVTGPPERQGGPP